jgi:hypothetical protein
MNLGKLLFAGRSLFGGNRQAEYRLDKHFYLPKFNEGRNRYAPKAAEEKPPAVRLLPDEPKARVQASGGMQAATGRPMSPEPAKLDLAKLAKPAKPAKAARPGWTARLNPFRAPEPAVAPAVRTTRQGEFSLDAVKVMHNDLADADVEVVPVSSRAAVPAAPELPAARQAWEYLGENLLKSQ